MALLPFLVGIILIHSNLTPNDPTASKLFIPQASS